MTTLFAHYDGRVLVPETPVTLPHGRLRIQVEDDVEPVKPLMALYEAIKDLPDSPDAPTDLAAQLDHYLYGVPKRS